VDGLRMGMERREGDDKHTVSSTSLEEKMAYTPLYGVDRPFFHIDLHDAVDAAVREAKRADERGCEGVSVDSVESVV
jgi:sodium-independent sulfate anion transporter 11